MKVNSSILVSFVAGIVLASLPYTLSSGKTLAQAAGPGQREGGLGGIGGGGYGGGSQGGGQQGNPVYPPGQGSLRFQNPPGVVPMVNSMTTSGEFLFASAGDVIYKIRISNMSIEGQTRLPAPRGQQQGGGQLNRAGAGRPPQGGGNGSGGLGGANGGSTPPTK